MLIILSLIIVLAIGIMLSMLDDPWDAIGTGCIAVTIILTLLVFISLPAERATRRADIQGYYATISTIETARASNKTYENAGLTNAIIEQNKWLARNQYLNHSR